MAHLNALLAPGAAPVIGRLFEAGAAFEDIPVAQRAPAPPPPPPVLPVLPLVGAVQAYRPCASISVTRSLSLAHDLFLADHHFIDATTAKPLAHCLPVLPMTVSLEMMAETAACLAPGLGLVGFEDVTARRWIAVEEAGTLALRIEGRVCAAAADGGTTRIAVQIFAGENATAAIDATVCFGTHHTVAPPTPPLAPVSASAEHDAAALYARRQLFHGPRFQGLCGQVQLAPEGASGSLLARDAADWFAGQPHPQLLTDAALLDTVGQLIALWAMQRGLTAFPIGLGRLDLHGPTPPAGMRLPIHVRIRGTDIKVLHADIEIGDGAGGTWARIADWKMWLFEWAPQLLAFQRDPERVLLAEDQAVPAGAAGAACRRIRAETLKGYDLAMLARYYLHPSEWSAFTDKSGRTPRQREWLLGRIAVKDAARAWRGAAALHPASFAVVNNASGQPSLAHWPPGESAPHISIAHTAGHAIGLAGHAAVGIDIEAIAPRDAHCVATLCTPAELRLLAAVPAEQRDAWISRLWCAKEATGKRLGMGVPGPHGIEASELAADFSLHMRVTASGQASRVATVRDNHLIIAFDTGAGALAP